MKQDSIDEFILLAGALSEIQRVKALFALQAGELCACQIIDYLGLAPSTVSRHLAVLRQAGLIESRKAGRWVHYRVSGNSSPLAVSLSGHAVKAFRESCEFQSTQSILEKICKNNPGIGCRELK